MRHNRDEKRFDRTYSHLRSMFAGMTNDLITAGRIKTTVPRAKALRRYAERMITLGKSGTLAARRRAFAFLRSKAVVTRLFGEIAPRYKDRNGGYTRILKIGDRPGDAAPMSFIELVEAEVRPEAKAAKKAATKKRATAKKKTPAAAAGGTKKAKAKEEKKEPA